MGNWPPLKGLQRTKEEARRSRRSEAESYNVKRYLLFLCIWIFLCHLLSTWEWLGNLYCGDELSLLSFTFCGNDAVTIGGLRSIFLAFYMKNRRLQKLEASVVMPFLNKGVP